MDSDDLMDVVVPMTYRRRADDSRSSGSSSSTPTQVNGVFKDVSVAASIATRRKETLQQSTDAKAVLTGFTNSLFSTPTHVPLSDVLEDTLERTSRQLVEGVQVVNASRDKVLESTRVEGTYGRKQAAGEVININGGLRQTMTAAGQVAANQRDEKRGVKRNFDSISKGPATSGGVSGIEPKRRAIEALGGGATKTSDDLIPLIADSFDSDSRINGGAVVKSLGLPVSMGVPPLVEGLRQISQTLQQSKSDATSTQLLPRTAKEADIYTDAHMFAYGKLILKQRTSCQTEPNDIKLPANASFDRAITSMTVPGKSVEALSLETLTLMEPSAPSNKSASSNISSARPHERKLLAETGLDSLLQMGQGSQATQHVSELHACFAKIFRLDTHEASGVLDSFTVSQVHEMINIFDPTALESFREAERLSNLHASNQGVIKAEFGGAPVYEKGAAVAESGQGGAVPNSRTFAAKTPLQAQRERASRSVLASYIFRLMLKEEREKIVIEANPEGRSNQFSPPQALINAAMKSQSKSVPTFSEQYIRSLMKQPVPILGPQNTELRYPLCCNGQRCVMQTLAGQYAGMVANPRRAAAQFVTGETRVGNVPSLATQAPRIREGVVNDANFVLSPYSSGFIGRIWMTEMEDQEFRATGRPPEKANERTCVLCHIKAVSHYCHSHNNNRTMPRYPKDNAIINAFEVNPQEWDPAALLKIEDSIVAGLVGHFPTFIPSAWSYYQDSSKLLAIRYEKSRNF
jgi:hypothetical protein